MKLNVQLVKSLLREAMEKPTQEMVDGFEMRTKEHIDRVKKNMAVLAANLDVDKGEWKARADKHDHTKYEDYRDEYIWLTKWYKEGKDDSIFTSPADKDTMWKASNKHVRAEKHHPQAWSNPKDMKPIDLAEMVSDWYAMSQELGDDIFKWVEKTVPKYKFTSKQEDLIYDYVGILVEEDQ